MPEDAQGCRLPPAETPQARAARGETFSLEFTLPAVDGSCRWYEANGQPLHDGGAGHAVVVIRDITLSSQHRRLMAQEEELWVKGALPWGPIQRTRLPRTVAMRCGGRGVRITMQRERS